MPQIRNPDELAGKDIELSNRPFIPSLDHALHDIADVDEIVAAVDCSNQLGLSVEEIAFYDALTKPQAVKDFYDNDQLVLGIVLIPLTSGQA